MANSVMLAKERPALPSASEKISHDTHKVVNVW